MLGALFGTAFKRIWNSAEVGIPEQCGCQECQADAKATWCWGLPVRVEVNLPVDAHLDPVAVPLRESSSTKCRPEPAVRTSFLASGGCCLPAPSDGTGTRGPSRRWSIGMVRRRCKCPSKHGGYGRILQIRGSRPQPRLCPQRRPRCPAPARSTRQLHPHILLLRHFNRITNYQQQTQQVFFSRCCCPMSLLTPADDATAQDETKIPSPKFGKELRD